MAIGDVRIALNRIIDSMLFLLKLRQNSVNHEKVPLVIVYSFFVLFQAVDHRRLCEEKNVRNFTEEFQI